jgi:hypothetical protein
MNLKHSDRIESPRILVDKDCRIRGIRVDVADALEERAEELGVRHEDSLTIIVALGLYSYRYDPKPCLGELAENPKVMALFK